MPLPVSEEAPTMHLVSAHRTPNGRLKSRRRFATPKSIIGNG
jgi:hypothetical protein